MTTALIEDLRLNHEYCSKEGILDAANEIERLNTQVAMLMEAIKTQLEQNPIYGIDRDLLFNVQHKSPSDWLSAHDQQVRDKALEDAISGCLRDDRA